ncbi:acyl carrier protein [Streptomyces sp. SAJ15]|uniref:acyl carrier protein n=1 Tax=Streptomyces sp. SAJ15 TaxID=2011095 RepID=UPI001186A3FF|nr:acyl carrier protein [Streptomyces sp. SAJ15]TVL88160.1 acyl carrier protein [Streptomyces sp. SAJ15]
MSTPLTLDRLRQIMRATLGSAADALDLDGEILDTPFADLEIDSLAVLEIVTQIQDEYRMRIPDDAVDAMKTPRAVLDYVNEHVEVG